MRCQRTMSDLVTAWPSRSRSRMSSGRRSRMKLRTSSRNASSSSLRRRSIGAAPLFGISDCRDRATNGAGNAILQFRLSAKAGRDHPSSARPPQLEGPDMAELPGKALAQELAEDAVHRLFGRLWTLERMFYYIYGGWGQGLEMNDFPPSVKYLFARQIVDESTHEMLYMDALLRQGCVATQKEAFRHPYGKFAVDSPTAYYVFSLRNLATYPHPIRIAALNLGPKIIE